MKKFLRILIHRLINVITLAFLTKERIKMILIPKSLDEDLKKGVSAYISRLQVKTKYQRDLFPVRGFLRRDPNLSFKFYNTLIKELFTFIDNLNSPVAKTLLEWETFQANAKGPSGPFSSNQFMSQTISGLRSGHPVDIRMRDIFEEHFSMLWEYLSRFSFKGHVNSIDFSQEWAKLPNTTVRGYPYFSRGSFVDSAIIEKFGASYRGAAAGFLSQPKVICGLGFRITGKKKPKPPKIRTIQVPDVYYQYFINGLVSKSMEKLKYAPAFSGWRDPGSKVNNINQMRKSAKQRGFVLMEMDYSGFDNNIQPWMRSIVARSFLNFRGADPETVMHYDRLMHSQFAWFINERGEPVEYDCKYKLLSGVKNTQHDGSLINLTMQSIIANELGYKLPYDLALCLGDDTVLPVPLRVYKRLGKKGVLTKISGVLELYGMSVNPDKCYPGDEFVFLQKLYDQSGFITDQGSWARSLASFCWPENFRTPIRGVKSTFALDIIAQISILREAHAFHYESPLNAFSACVARMWLQHDKLLRNLCGYANAHSFDANRLFYLLVDLVGNDKDAIFSELGIKSYDHKGLGRAIDSGLPENTFPILKDLLELSGSDWSQDVVDGLLKDLTVRESYVGFEDDVYDE